MSTLADPNYVSHLLDDLGFMELDLARELGVSLTVNAARRSGLHQEGAPGVRCVLVIAVSPKVFQQAWGWRGRRHCVSERPATRGFPAVDLLHRVDPCNSAGIDRGAPAQPARSAGFRRAGARSMRRRRPTVSTTSTTCPPECIPATSKA
jgi:hypothetical protein